MTQKNTPNQIKLIIEQTLILAQEKNWGSISFADLSKATGIGIENLQQLVPNKTQLLIWMLDEIDLRIQEECRDSFSDEDGPHERLFEVLMLRFDILNENRQAYVAIYHAIRKDPKLMAQLLPEFSNSMQLMLELVGVNSSFQELNRLKSTGLGMIYLNVFQTWVEDQSGDLSKTMAVLDKRLNQAGGMMQYVTGLLSKWQPDQHT